MKELAVKVSNITKAYKLYGKQTDRLIEALSPFKKNYHKDFYALNGISFDIYKGETIGIIGTNGSGKSTLLKIITGVLTETSGDIEVKGRISALLELGAGFNPEYTGIENINLSGTMMGYSENEIKSMMVNILDFADIGQFIYQPVKTYSSGMFVRLAFAVAINVDPDILIVDEALSVGDMFFQAKCYKKFDEFRKNGKTIILVTHDMGSILKYCDRAVVLNKGDLIDTGEPGKMVDIYKRILVGLHVDKVAGAKDKVEVGGKTTSDWKSMLITNPNILDYGNKKAEIIDFAIVDMYNSITNAIMKKSEFEIKFKVKFNEDITEPIFAFTIKDIKGTEITGTNTMLEYVNAGNIKAGSIVEVDFKQKIVLQGGSYLISLGCTGFEKDNFVVYHRLYDVCNIDVISDKDSIGYFDLDSEIEIKKS